MNPVFELANNMAATAEAHMPQLIATPKCPPGLFEYEYNEGMIPLVCHLEYEAGQRETAIDPSFEAQMHLCAAYIGGIEVTKGLNAVQIAAIELEAIGCY